MKRKIIILLFAFLFLFTILIGQEKPNYELTTNTKNLLKQPFNLYSFKKKKKQSNSGGSNKTNYYFKPSEGVYWHFMLFPPVSGYIGKIPATDIHLEDGLEITTFQPKDKYQNQYLNPNETLIQVVERYNDIDLPELAFVGLDTTEIKKKLGPSSEQKKDCFIYFDGNNILALHIRKGKVNWLKYTRLNLVVSKDNIPDELLMDKFDESYIDPN